MNLADLIYERIKHGDEKHQQWLREKSNEVAAEFLGMPSEIVAPPEQPQEGRHYYDAGGCFKVATTPSVTTSDDKPESGELQLTLNAIDAAWADAYGASEKSMTPTAARNRVTLLAKDVKCGQDNFRVTNAAYVKASDELRALQSAELARSDRHATWNAAMERAAEICGANLADDPIGKFGVAECAKDIRASKLPLPTPRPGMKFPEREMPSASAARETDERFAKREAKNIVNSADAQCFRWLLKHHGGSGPAMAGVGDRCWIGGVEFHGNDVATAILEAIDREEGNATDRRTTNG